MTVGVYTNSSGVRQTLVESWNGTTWSIVPSPNEGSDNNILTAVSCPLVTSCIAVGAYFDSSTGAYQTLVESWNGASWSIVPSPNRGLAATDNFLYGASCSSAGACMAVGYYYKTSTVYRTLIESWNGSSWSIMPSPNRGLPTSNDAVIGVSCPVAGFCAAVGYYGNKSGVEKTLVESWNGSSWSIVSSPNRGLSSSNNYFNGVFCLSASSCMAVGYHTSSPGTGDRTLVESWNGASWSVTPSSNRRPDNNALWGVFCTSPNACTAVGDSATSNLGDKTLIESWNGTTWALVPSPNRGTSSYQNTLIGVSCAATSSCIAAGYIYSTNGVSESRLIESWNGTTWALVPNPT